MQVEAALAPQDSRKQADANFYGGIWDSISCAGEALWGAISDPGGTVAAMAHNVLHPVETFKAITAWDDWANGHGDRALGKITGSMLLGFGTGKLVKDGLSRTHHDTDIPAEHRPGTPASTPEARVERVQQGITDNHGNLLGVEDSKGVRLIDEAQLNQVRQHFHDTLGTPTKVYETPKGTVEFWEISTDPKQQVVYRTYSGSGGATIDINGVSGVDMKRFHIK